MLSKKFRDHPGMANIDVVMLITADGRNQIVARLLRGSLRPEKLRPHVVVDSDNMHPPGGKIAQSF